MYMIIKNYKTNLEKIHFISITHFHKLVYLNEIHYSLPSERFRSSYFAKADELALTNRYC